MTTSIAAGVGDFPCFNYFYYPYSNLNFLIFFKYLSSQIFIRSELEMMAEMCHKYNALCISDEVYEWLIYDDNVFTKIGAQPLYN